MKWDRVNSTCIRSGSYRISLYRLRGMDYYEIYCGETLIGDAPDGNKARAVAEKHSDKRGAES